MVKYDHQAIESKWAALWVKQRLYAAMDHSSEPKSYILIEFPYPSGERLHVGHARSYSCLDAVARMRRMQGQNVMFPFGWDAFGLPAENYAIKTGVHPSVTTAANIANARKQVISWGMSLDWDREVNTTDPAYYRWTQWIFLQLFKMGLAYKEEIAVNWCPSCKINLANEEVVSGACERCGTATQRRNQQQWLLKITEYADRLLGDLGEVEYRSDIRMQQENWIGRKVGINIRYEVEGGGEVVVFTTRPDTNFGATFIVVAPEHELAREAARRDGQVARYVESAMGKSELERLADGRKKSGVATGRYAINKFTGEKLPIWVSDFVLGGFGTGAVVGVPGHDKRDFEFARAMGLPVRRVVVGNDGDASEIVRIEQVQEEAGTMVNSGFLDGLSIKEAIPKMTDYLVEKGWGVRSVSYHLRDWVFSRQHYWGEPIPMVFCESCSQAGRGWVNTGDADKYFGGLMGVGGGKVGYWTKEQSEKMKGWMPLVDADLPLKLPEVERYQPTDTGESPLSGMSEWVDAKCPYCGGHARRETDTMPNWAGSSWYYLRYCDAYNEKELAARDKLEYWMPVDWYNGGMEHTTLHLLYSRFWHKVLYDLGLVNTVEPYRRRTSHGVVLGPDGKRMSKSKGNVINPDDVVAKYGADTLRVYEMFIGPFDQMVIWSDRAVSGVYRFLRRIWELVTVGYQTVPETSSAEINLRLARLVQKVSGDLESMKFNTAVAACMEFVNYWALHRGQMGRDAVEAFIKMMAPMAPFLSEELWQLAHPGLEGKWSVHQQPWVELRGGDVRDEMVEIVVQINGKLREKMAIPRVKVSEALVLQMCKESAKLQSWLSGKTLVKTVWVADKLINFVVR